MKQKFNSKVPFPTGFYLLISRENCKEIKLLFIFGFQYFENAKLLALALFPWETRVKVKQKKSH